MQPISVKDCIGQTPCISLLSLGGDVELLGKVEFLNPGGSIKDRVAEAVLSGIDIKQPHTFVIPTSGNLGISLALLLRAHNGVQQDRKHRVICVIPERTSSDRIGLLKTLGVEIVRAPNAARPDASESMFSVAKTLAGKLHNAIVIEENSQIAEKAYTRLAEELLQQTEVNLDYLFVGVESGACISVLAKALKAKIPHLKVVGVEPKGSQIGQDIGSVSGRRADWKVEDIGSNFTPASLDKQLVDMWVQVADADSYTMARRLVTHEGLLAGPSSGAVVFAAAEFAKTIAGAQHSTHRPRIACILNDTARNYSSTLLSEEWLLENGVMDEDSMRTLEYLRSERYRAASVEDLQLPTAVTISPHASLAQATDLMLEREFSQLPVIDSTNKKLIGYISLADCKNALDNTHAPADDSVEKWMVRFPGARQGKKDDMANGPKAVHKYQLITPDTPLSELAAFFETNSFAVVTDEQRKWCLGVATKLDLIAFLNRRNGF